MRNRKRSRAELENDLDAKAAPADPFARMLYLMAQIATEENWLDYYNSKNQPAPLVERIIATMRAELHALMDAPALSNDELIIKRAAARVGATAVLIGAHNPGELRGQDDDPASINSAGAGVYRTEPPAEDLGTHVIISGGEVLELDGKNYDSDYSSWAEDPY